MPEVVDTHGRHVSLGKEIGRGGEAIVFEIVSDDTKLAKIFHAPLTQEKADKIRLMPSLRSEAISKLAAWPIDLLSKPSGEPIGLLMPKIVGRKDIHRLYSPKSRRNDFQRADWRFLIRAAANTARAFAAVHDAGCVIGDVNHGGVLVGQDATVCLIDCDSFQIISGGRQFLCEVGIEDFMPPELQGRTSYRDIVRTANQDAFGLAVLIFLMLFMGRHPFAGRYLGAGEMLIPKAIEQSRFAYGVRRSDLNMERPPGTPPLAIVGDDVATLFELAFAAGTIRRGRPAAKQWIAALDGLERNLKQCSLSSSHWHIKTAPTCPWCQMEGATGVAIFPLLIQAEGILFDIDALWRQVEALGHPGPAPIFEEAAVPPSAGARSVNSRETTKNLVAGLVAAAMIGTAILVQFKGGGTLLFFGGIAAFFVIRTVLDKSDEVHKFRRELDGISAKWTAAQSEWVRNAGPADFDEKKKMMLSLRRDLSEIPSMRLRKLDQLKHERRDRQLGHFLDRFEIDSARIEGIGPGRKRTLASYNIETAADIDIHKIANVPGFGPKLQSTLLDWRQSLARSFQFDPQQAIDPRDIAKVEQDIIVDKRRIEEKLKMTFEELKRSLNRVNMVRRDMRPQMESVHREFSQASANYRVARGMT